MKLHKGESLPNHYRALSQYSALQLAYACACVTGLQHGALYRFEKFVQKWLTAVSRRHVISVNRKCDC